MVQLTNRRESKNEQRNESCGAAFENASERTDTEAETDRHQYRQSHVLVGEPAFINGYHVLQLLQVLHTEDQLFDDVKNRQNLQPSVQVCAFHCRPSMWKVHYLSFFSLFKIWSASRFADG